MTQADDLSTLLSLNTEVAIDRNPLRVSGDLFVCDVLRQMAGRSLPPADAAAGASVRSSYALIVEQGQLLGILTERDVVRLTAQGEDLATTKVATVMTTGVIKSSLEELSHPLSVLEVLRQHQIRHMPVIDDQGEIVGVATLEHMRQSLKFWDLLRLRQVHEVMSPSVVTAPPTQSLLTLVQIMAERRISCVVIAVPHPDDPTAQQPIGIVTERDIVQLQTQQLAWADLTAADVMSAPLVCMDVEASLWEVHLRMQALRVRRMVVVRQGKLAGLITQTSLLAALDPIAMYNAILSLKAEVDDLKQQQMRLLQQQNAQLEVQISKTDRRFQAIFNNTFQFTGLLSLGGMLLEANQTALDFGGLKPEDVLHRPFWEAHWWTISAATQAQLKAAVRRAAQGEFVRYEVEVLGANAQVMCIDFSIRPLRDESGQIVLLIPEGRDITAQKISERALQTQLKLNQLVAEISTRFVQIQPNQVGAQVQRALQELGEFIQVDTSYVFHLDHENRCFSMTHEWVQSGLTAHIAQAQAIPQEAFPWSLAQLRRGEILQVDDRRALSPAAAVDQQAWENFDLMSLLAIPLLVDQQIVGWLGFGTFARVYTWSDDHIRLLKIFAEMLTHVLQRQQASQALHQSEQRYAILAQASPVGIFRTNVNGQCLSVNDRWSQIAGLSIAAALGDGWATAIHPDDRDRVFEEWNASVVENRPFNLEYRFQRSDGTVTWVLGQAVVECDESGQRTGYVGTITDITALKQAARLKSELRLLEDIVEATLAGYWDWDITAQTLYLSPTFKQMLGYADAELTNVPETLERLAVHEPQSESIFERLIQHAQTRGQAPFHAEVRYRHKNADVIWVIFAGRVIEWDTYGQPRRFVGCHVDITPRKRTQQQLQKLNQELQRSNQELEQYAYVTSHDLQEPLRAITGYTQLLLQNYGAQLSEPEAQEYLDYIMGGASRMRQLIQDLLEYSRLGRHDLALERVDCAVVLDDVLQDLQGAIQAANATITSDPLPMVLADRHQLYQLFQNLLSNGIKFQSDQPPQIHISVATQSTADGVLQPESPDPMWCFAVCDNGIGIKSQYHERIFAIFRRLHSQNKFPGTGIGLAICKKVLELHGGKIWVTSQLGAGSTFHFTWPIAVEEEDD
ncbi:PAS domain S-box protein [filamentous cyanobacterium LEGE 11480]|uniref:histidine kinase n=1 Tax=Romeriopsis navalis LEGE 11480 TaxID=2777977 RepID=A0A928VMU7_9CYAN|nr:PAS domain S-box protein [Romeriopsis navalis]MBE9030522.1 PAS domain S-box protein [Romeriopsis navalis LEGE 11480]